MTQSSFLIAFFEKSSVWWESSKTGTDSKEMSWRFMDFRQSDSDFCIIFSSLVLQSKAQKLHLPQSSKLQKLLLKYETINCNDILSTVTIMLTFSNIRITFTLHWVINDHQLLKLSNASASRKQMTRSCLRLPVNFCTRRRPMWHDWTCWTRWGVKS